MLFEKQGCETIRNPYGRILTEEEMCELCRDVDGVIVGVDPISARVMSGAKHLKGISKYGAGTDNIDIDTAEDLGIAIRTAVGTNATSVAELTIGLLICLCRHIPYSVSSTRNGDWNRRRGHEVMGSTVGLVGCGSIGREVARRISALGANVLIYDAVEIDRGSMEACRGKQVDLETLLAESDIVSLHCPSTPQTTELINRDTIACMKDGAMLINTARGDLVNEEALYEALVEGKLAGAAQDVFSSEPPERGHKLLNLDNFILTAHIGALTEEAVMRMATKAIENMVELLQGKGRNVCGTAKEPMK